MEMELLELDIVDDGVNAGGVYTGGLLSEAAKEMLGDGEADVEEPDNTLLDLVGDIDILELSGV
jgi:hypothetical protein